VPPPATALLLQGFPVHDDGRPGERTTPTGAAILRQLAPGHGMPRGAFAMGRVGHGFGTKRFKGISNVLRVASFEPLDAGDAAIARDEVGVIRFEVDDQPAEDLAVGLERLRAMPGVLDALQAPAFGKKGRMVAQVQVLARADAIEAVAAACLAETSTLGLRIERAERRILAREAATRDDGAGGAVRVKTATRPDGSRTAKAEMDDVAAAGDHAARTRLRRRVEDA
ncbi:MAG: nickel insertion protein, partial [Alphaproteobacteria bacterium]